MPLKSSGVLLLNNVLAFALFELQKLKFRLKLFDQIHLLVPSRRRCHLVLETWISTLVTLDLVVVYFNAHRSSLPICLEYVSVTVTLSICIQAKKGSLHTSFGFYENTIYVIANCHALIYF